MAFTNDQQGPFWDFVRGMDHNGAGVDRAGGPFNRGTQPGHPAGPHIPPPPPFGTVFPIVGWGGPAHGHYHGPDCFPFGGPERHGHDGPGFFGTRGGCGRRHHRENPGSERSRSRTASPGGGHEHSGREGEARDDHPHPHPHGPRGDRHGRGGHGPRGGRGPRSGQHGPGRRGPPPPPFAAPGPMGMGFDLSGLYQALTSHPAVQQHPLWAQILRPYALQARSAGERPGSGPAEEDAPEDTFTPPIDVFSTEAAYVLHIALPGAKKEDVGVTWDADKGELNIAGVVYRPGDESFLKSLKSGERRVGAFGRSVKLPPGGEEEEVVDGEGIGAKLEDGVLVITVPKVEREWIEVKKVDIN